jgi:hypothetical protein
MRSGMKGMERGGIQNSNVITIPSLVLNPLKMEGKEKRVFS